jgi:hypothetical protein
MQRSKQVKLNPFLTPYTKLSLGCDCSSVIEHLANKYKTLGSILSYFKKNRNKQKPQNEFFKKTLNLKTKNSERKH